ncbi:MAG TPA: hypothetical protein VK021_05210 [Flavobacteriaceae bacterium]|nr:hypothetical protein [Flavobacteriaceae bacterium]
MNKNVMKNLSIAAIVLLMSSVFVACTSDDDTGPTPIQSGSLAIMTKATYAPVTTNSLDVNFLEISSFKVNFEEIELEYNDDFVPESFDNDPYYDSMDDIELEGPFEVELMSAEPVTIVDIPVPNGVIEEIEFEFDKGKNSDSDLYNKSMKMEGMLDGQPFVFWHDFEEEIEIEFEEGNQDLVIQNNESEVIINFDLNEVFGGIQHVDMSQATDGNGDGVIEISPEDDDGNNQLAEELKQAIKAHIEFIEDMYED